VSAVTEIETERLHLRPLEMSDLDAVHALQRDPLMRRYIGDGHPLTIDESREWLKGHVDGWKELGYGFFAVELRSSSQLIGWLGLNKVRDHPDLDGETEIGWSIDPHLWRSGLATEGAREALKFGFTQVGLKRIVARYRSDNRASGVVVEKIGMHHWKDVPHVDLPQETIMLWEVYSPTHQTP
jgi:RimJ/RimL family protein N-acetyltransferase